MESMPVGLARNIHRSPEGGQFAAHRSLEPTGSKVKESSTPPPISGRAGRP